MSPSVVRPSVVVVFCPSVRRRRSLSVRPVVRCRRRCPLSVRLVVRCHLSVLLSSSFVRPSRRPSWSSSSVRSSVRRRRPFVRRRPPPPSVRRRPLSVRPSSLPFVNPSLVVVLCLSAPPSVWPVVRFVLRPAVLRLSHGVTRTCRARDACLVAYMHAGRI